MISASHCQTPYKKLTRIVKGPIFRSFEAGTPRDADFHVAFDSLPHSLLLAKMSKFGFSDGFIRWLSSYLSNRSCRVKNESYLSEEFFLTSGVPFLVC